VGYFQRKFLKRVFEGIMKNAYFEVLVDFKLMEIFVPQIVKVCKCLPKNCLADRILYRRKFC